MYVHRDHEMTWTDHVEAARLALPTTARTTGVTRLRQLGLDVGSAFPLHFVIEGDHHLVLDGVFLHRTVKMPACDEVGATVEAAFDCVIGMDGEGRIVEFNAAAERCFGHRRDTVLGRSLGATLLP